MTSRFSLSGPTICCFSIAFRTFSSWSRNFAASSYSWRDAASRIDESSLSMTGLVWPSRKEHSSSAIWRCSAGLTAPTQGPEQRSM